MHEKNTIYLYHHALFALDLIALDLIALDLEEAAMIVALCSDEMYPVHARVEQELLRRGHQIVKFGALREGFEVPWARCAEEAALAVANGACTARQVSKARLRPAILASRSR